jgi:mannose-6-phosphate isomerase-like protein (cupin superfamily)
MGEQSQLPRVPLAVSWEGEAARQMLLDGPPQTCGMRSGRMQLGPGEDVGRHTTGNHEEILIILAGAGRLECDGREPLAVRAGQAAYVPPGTFHNVRSTGAGVLRYVFVVAPAGRGARR